MTSVNNLFKSTSETGSYSDLLQRRAAGEPVRAEVLEEAKLQVLQGDLTGKFIYTVSTNETPVSYLIGTYHHVSKKMAEDPILLETVRKCDQLFLECIDEFTAEEMIGGAHAAQQSAQQEFKQSCAAAAAASDETDDADKSMAKEKRIASLRMVGMDETLKIEAERAKIPVEGLENKKDRAMMRKEYEEKAHIPTPYRAAIGTNLWNITRTDAERMIEVLQYYQKGDSLQVDSFMRNSMTPDLHRILITSRNIKWLNGSEGRKGLIQLFRERGATPGSKPIGVVVGVGHLLGRPGENGMIDLLRKSDFTVTKHNQVVVSGRGTSSASASLV